MAKKRYRPEEIIAMLREAVVLLARGMKVPEVARTIGIHEITCCRWRKEHGGIQKLCHHMHGRRCYTDLKRGPFRWGRSAPGRMEGHGAWNTEWMKTNTPP